MKTCSDDILKYEKYCLLLFKCLSYCYRSQSNDFFVRKFDQKQHLASVIAELGKKGDPRVEGKINSSTAFPIRPVENL